MRTHLVLSALLAIGTLGCRPDLGDPDYPEITPYGDTDGGGGLPGDNPFDGSTPRLSFGQFYEGGSTDQLAVDDENVFYFIYQGYTQNTSSERVEGFVSDQLTLSGSSWWGGGVQFADGTSQDLSAWKTLHIALMSEDAEMDVLRLGVAGTGGEVRINPADYGFVADGEWHVLNVPMSTFASVNLAQVNVALLIIAESGTAGTSVFMDDFYLEGE